ncbi:MAG: NAD(P)/FAD-dependent oxidoreductase [Aquirhabdus sp.]
MPQLNHHPELATAVRHVEIAVLGAGFAGIGAAIRFIQAGITDFVVLEKASEIGGVWRENTYPGCACDVPSALYSYSFAPNPHWSRMFAEQAEIKAYIKDTAERFGVMPYVKLNHEMLESTWDNEQKHWVVQTSAGVFFARFVVMACGPMHEPVYPNIKGLKSFKGMTFHSACWRHDYNLQGKRVAVIGTGASAIQFVPKIQPQVAKLTLIQRTPQWVLPKLDQVLPKTAQTIFKYVPLTQQTLRGGIYGIFETLNGSMQHPQLMKKIQRLAIYNINRAVKDEELRNKLMPDFIIGCKRILQSNDWYPALVQPNVDVVRSGIQEIKGNTVITSDGSKHEVDAIILATGFEISTPQVLSRVRGRSGQTVAEVWQGSPEGYMGTMTVDCPNAFLMFGPNLGVSSSAFIIIEAQLNYILDALRQVHAQKIKTIEVDPENQIQFNRKVQDALQDSVWNTGGCQSYFIDANGRNSTIWPWSTFEMRYQLSRFDLSQYIVNEASTTPQASFT